MAHQTTIPTMPNILTLPIPHKETLMIEFIVIAVAFGCSCVLKCCLFDRD